MIRMWKLFQRWLPSIGPDNPHKSLHSAEVMQGIVDRERMRCDRGNSSFALLTLTFAKPWNASELDVLARVFRERIRATDDAGLMGPRRLGVVLPETHPEGAWKLAGDLCDLLPASTSSPGCDVYMYPTHASNGTTNAIASNGEAKAATNGKTTGRPPQRGARPMHALFVQPLPVWKRAIDVIGAATLGLLAAPLMLLVAAAIKLTSRGPIIFAQKRDAIGGRQFTMYKFRTMVVDADAKKAALVPLSEQDGPAFKIAKDPRVTRLGRFLRVTTIDELPQLFNVLWGDMSLVGPRPLPCDESSRCEPWQRRRLDVTPGLTCIWQIRGRSAVSFSKWIRMDIEYIQSRSLVNDVKLIVQTVPAVVFRRGAG